MMKKKGNTKTILETMAIALILLILSTGIAGAYSNPLSVPFITQYPPGTSWTATQNCGQASSLMVFSYYDGITPTEQGIKDIDTWLYNRFGDPINNWDGTATDTTKLLALAQEYGGKYGVFPNSYKSSGWTIDRVKQEIDAGHPVIVEVDGINLPPRTYRVHFLVAKGYTSTSIITNDPGTIYGNGAQYSNANFAAAMSARGGRVVVVIPNPITVTSPNGGENWPVGSFRTIQWSYTGNPGSLVNIDLVKSTGTVTSVAIWVPIGSNNAGSYSFWVTQSAGSYKARVTTNYGYVDSSKDYFTVQ